tara:strand:- start:720 stop:1625 length:906 start_codon:yes stop_codon:yes gene_type:complete
MYLIVGASGFVGKRLYKRLKSYDHPVKTLSRNKDPLFSDHIKKDLLIDEIQSDELHNINTIFYLAAKTHDLKSPDKHLKEEYESLNYKIPTSLLELAEKVGVENFIYISSIKAGLINEDTNKDYLPKEIYGKTKRKAELALLGFSEKPQNRIRVNILRPALIYGPGMKGNLKSMLTGIKQGWFPPLPETFNRKSLIHVDDLIRAILFIATKPDINSQIFNVTDQQIYSTKNIYESLMRSQGKKIPYLSLPFSFFKIIGKLSSNLEHRITKLFDDQYFSSKKIESLGFKTKMSLDQCNENLF